MFVKASFFSKEKYSSPQMTRLNNYRRLLLSVILRIVITQSINHLQHSIRLCCYTAAITN
ncbi:hypothetical protein GJV44_00366 [Candidatus Vallotia cooleyia]|nr:hypothetical protein GJV44_00366 [Candidatus Vallotia cooleyia]